MSRRGWQQDIALKLCVHFNPVACLRNSHLGMSFKEVVGMPSWNPVPPPPVCSLLTSDLGMVVPALQTPSDAAEYVVWLHRHPDLSVTNSTVRNRLHTIACSGYDNKSITGLK